MGRTIHACVAIRRGEKPRLAAGRIRRALAGGHDGDRDSSGGWAGPHYMRNSRKPRTSTRPVPFRAHSPCTSARWPSLLVSAATRNRPPGITIFPEPPRCRGIPAALRSLLVNRRGAAAAGTGGGDGDGDGEEMGLREAVSDKAGVSASSTSASASMSASALCTTAASPRTVPRRVRFAALVLAADTSDDPDDSSNERLGERCSRSRVYKPGGSDDGEGEADRELGRGMSAGVGRHTTGTTVAEDPDCRSVREVRRGRDSGFGAETGTGGSLEVEVEAARGRALFAGLEEGLGTEGRSCGDASGGSSETSGRPECGPRRLRMEEKCSQS